MKEQIEAVKRMQDYINNHLFEKITLNDLSKVSLFSPWYSHRIFLQFTKKTPADYIRRLRLSKSALKLRDEDCKVIDVAFQYGFGSVDGYQRAFLKEFGCNPKEYSKHPVPLYLLTPYEVKFPKIKRGNNDMKEVKSVFVQVIEKPRRKVIIKRGVKAKDYYEYCDEVGCDVWGMLMSIKSISGEPVCMWLPKSYILPGTSQYVQGVEVKIDYDESLVPEGFELIELPAAKFLMFQGEPFEEEDYEEAIDEIWQSIKKYDPSFIGYEWDEENPRIQLEPIGERGYIELMPIR